jgi:hypothetical protein
MASARKHPMPGKPKIASMITVAPAIWAAWMPMMVKQ